MCVGGAFDRKVESEGNLAGNEGQPKRVHQRQDKRGTGFPIQRIGDGAGSLGPMMPARGMKG